MMRMRIGMIAGMALAATTLAGCGSRKDHATDTDTASIQISGGNDAADGNAQTLAVNVPGFSAKLAVPGLDLTGDTRDIDGIPLHPGTKISGLNVNGTAGDGSGGESHGTVHMHFADPAAPDALVAYYRDAAKKAGWTETPPAAGQQFAATKPKEKGSEQLGLIVSAKGSGSEGRFLVSGS